MPKAGDKIKILTTIKAYKDFFDAEKYLLGDHNHDYNYTTLSPGDYYVFGVSAGNSNLVNISKTSGKTGWWINITHNVEPEKINIVTTLQGYVDYDDAAKAFGDSHTHGPYNSVEIAPGEYYVFGHSAGLPNLANISKTAGRQGWWIDTNKNVEPEKIKLLTTLSGYENYSDAAKAFLSDHSHGPYNGARLDPGDYYLFGRSAGSPNLANISKTPGRTGYWIDTSQNIEPEKFKVEHGYKGYKGYQEAIDKSDSGWTLIPPGDYYVFGYFGGNKNGDVLNITRTPGQEWLWINKSQGDSDKNAIITLLDDTDAYTQVENAYSKKNAIKLPAGKYYHLFDSEDGNLAYISYLHMPMGPGYWVPLADLEDTSTRLDKITINLPIPAYESVKLALENDESKAKTKLNAGEYYVLSMHENGKVARVTTNPKETEGLYINLDENDDNGNADVSDGTGKKDPDPSNTGTTSGIDNKPKKSGSLTGKDASTVTIAGGYELTPCFIKNLITGTTIELRYGLPEGLSDSASASFEGANIRGRSNQIQGYSDTEARNISFEYTFHEELEPEGLLTTIARIKALEYPGYASVVEPPKCYLRLGNVVRGTFICTSADVSFRDDAGVRDDFYLGADVSFSFTETNDFARSAAEIEDGHGMIE